MDTSPVPTDDLVAIGIDVGHHDGFGNWQTLSPESFDKIRGAMGLDDGELPDAPGAIVVANGDGATASRSANRPRRSRDDAPSGGSSGSDAAVGALPDGTEVELDDGTRIAVSGELPPDLPVGYHRLLSPSGGSRPLLVSPGRCHLPDDLRIWGVTAQLYAARSSGSWGVGDLADLGRLIDWAGGRGAGLVGLNPLHAPTPSEQPPNSPYSPSSRRWRDPLMIALEQVPGFADLPDAATLVEQGRALNEGELVDRAAAWKLKRSALEALWTRFEAAGGDADFDRYLAENGPGLERWGVFCTLADDLDRAGERKPWNEWDSGVRRPDGPGVARVVEERPERVRFWGWLQWLVDRQLAASGAADVVLTDLAVGFAQDGFDAWEWQDLVAHGVRIGAPPDPLGRDGQDWGLPPFIPWRLSADGYGPLAQTMRAAFRHSRGVRIDHVMGLFRLFWLPPESGAAEGAYVRFAANDLLHVLAIESHRAGGIVVGEDLGTVEDGVRDTLGAARVLSTRLLWFEDQPTASWPAQAMAAVTTHDLPTIAGVWTGQDIEDLEAAGVTIPDEGDSEMRGRLRSAAGGDDGAALHDVVVAAHREVASSPSVVATAALDDLFAARRRPNVPGTVDEHPNWRIPLPLTLDDLPGHPLAEAVATTMSEHR